MEEPYIELAGNQFLTNYLPDNITPPSIANYGRLPYQDLSPKRFEQLCLKYAYATYGISKCSIYGNSGQGQHGLDILVAEPEGKYILYQCKHVKEFSDQDLIKALIKFTNGKWFTSTLKFVLFSSNELVEAHFLDEFEKQRTLLESKGIILEKMGCWESNEALKSHPWIVDEFFGSEWVEKFCKLPEKEDYLAAKKLLPPKKMYPEVADYIPRKLHNPLKFKTYYGHESFILQTLLAWVEECHLLGKPVRILIRSNAGLGKSKETEFIAHHFSDAGQHLYPVVILLKNYGGDLDKLVGAFYEKWKEVPKDRLFLLFDGLDEVPNVYQEVFTKEFNLLLQEYQRSNIIASARSNYSTAWVGSGSDISASLSTQTLQPLDDFDIQEYLQHRIVGAISLVKFNSLVKKNKLTELLQNPFYLKNLSDIFLENESSFPADRADAISKIIQLKLKNDATKYSLQAFQTQKFDLLAKRLAVFLTMTGSNSVTQDFIKELSDIPLADLRLCSLFKLDFVEGMDVIFFEHNNFQEYLTAHYFVSLPWERLAAALFHEPGGVILKPRLINTANYLFTLLDTAGNVYQAFFEILKNNNQELLLNFEKDKVPFPIRLEIFKAIIESGKKDEIYYLRSDYDGRDLLEFIEYNRAGFEYIITELSEPKIDVVHQQCLVELLFFFKPEKIVGNNREKLYRILRDIVLSSANGPTHDLAIDTLSIHGFHKSSDIRMILSKCPGINQQMVRGAWLKMVRKSRSGVFLKHVLKSAKVLFDNPHRVVAGLEYEFISYVKEQLNSENILLWLSFMLESTDMLASLLENIFSPDKRLLVNDIYSAMADIYLQNKNEKIYDIFINVIYKMWESHNDTLWGNPAIFFINSGRRKRAFFDLMNDGDNLMFRFVVNSSLVNHDILNVVAERYRNGLMPERSVNIVTNLLVYHKRSELYEYLSSGLPPEYFKQFTTSDYFDWNEKTREWQEMNFRLLTDQRLFFAEAEKLYKLVAEQENFDENRGWVDLQYSEKAILKKQINNDIIFKAIERNKIAGGFKNFVQWIGDIGWDWFVFFSLFNYLFEKKTPIPDNLLAILQKYTLKTLVPKVNFRTPYKLNEQGRIFSVPHAGSIRKLFLENYIKLPENILLDMLSFDNGGFTRIPPGDGLEERLVIRIYHLIGNKAWYKERILEEIKKGYVHYGVLESHCTACLAFHYPEAVPDLGSYLSKKSVSDDIKWNIIRTIAQLDNNSEVFINQLENIRTIGKYWQFEILKLVQESRHLMELLPPSLNLVALIERSIKALPNEHRLKFDLIKTGIKSGSSVAADYFFKFLKHDVNWHRFADIEFDDFKQVRSCSASVIVDKCFTLFPPVFARRDDRHNYLETFLRNFINHTAKANYNTMIYALTCYENFIAKYRSTYPSAIMVRWNEKELIKSYYLTATKFDDTSIVLRWVQQISA
jgi:hypothetical protein